MRFAGLLSLAIALCTMAWAQDVIGSLSGIVELPPEASPGETISFTPDESKLPKGSEGGTWTLCGVVAEPEEESEEPPSEPAQKSFYESRSNTANREAAPPPATEVGLKPEPAVPPLSEAQTLGLAIASAMNEPFWTDCLSGRPASGAIDQASKAGDPLPDVDVALEKKPSGSYAYQVAVSELTEEQVVAFKAATPANTHRDKEYVAPPAADFGWMFMDLHTADEETRYFGVDVSSEEFPSKSFYEIRSNTARFAPPDVAAYSLEEGNVQITTGDGLFSEAEPPPVVVAMKAQKPKGYVVGNGGDARAPQSVAFAAVKCQPLQPPAGAGEPARAGRARHDMAKAAIGNIKARALAVTIPEDWPVGKPFSMSYADASGKPVVNVPQVEGVSVVPPRGPVDPKPSLTAAPEFVMAGRPVCACGNFPGPKAWNGLMLDEREVGHPMSASSRMAILATPYLAPGRHVIAGTPEAGFSTADRVSFTALKIGGSLDSTKLLRGEKTAMALVVEGTEKPLSLRVRNLSPAIIQIDGGVDQVVTTSGGRPNRVERQVSAVSKGNFNIDFSLAADRCPCQTAAKR
jgi:hypothetical protein